MIFEGKEIVLFGHVAVCKRFYIQIHRLLSVIAIVTADDDSRHSVHGSLALPVYHIDEWKDYDRKSRHIIICYTTEEERYIYNDIMEKAGMLISDDYTDAPFVLSWFRKQMEVDWTKRDIWIFGAGKYGRFFYERYQKSRIPIIGFLSNYDSAGEYMGLPIIRPASLDRTKSPYIIICSAAYEEMAEQLETLGFVGIRDFCIWEWLPKKMFVAMGPCQIFDIAKMLICNNNFVDFYYYLLVQETINAPCSYADKKRLYIYGDICDVVFYRGRSLGDSGLPDNGQVIVEKFYHNAVRIYMPFYYFRGQLMQVTQEINPFSLTLHGVSLWFRGDQEVNTFLESGYPVEEIVEAVSGSAYWTEEEIIENFKMELHKIQILDRVSSIKIAEFIKKNYKHFTVFKDGTHFSIELMFFVVNEIFKLLNIMPFSKEEMRKIIEKTEPPYKTAMPVYPCVAKVLGMENQSDFFGFVKTDLSVDYVDFKEYIRRYAEYVLLSKRIIQENGSTFW